MERGAGAGAVVCAVVVCLLAPGRALADAGPHALFGGCDGCDAKAAPSTSDPQQKAAFWMGPRLGRAKRNPRQEDVYCAYVVEREPSAGGQQDAAWVILAVKKCKKSGDFIPRLGRESEEETWGDDGTPHRERWLEDPDYDVMQRSPPFVPRLGRHVLYSPRLGRDNNE